VDDIIIKTLEKREIKPTFARILILKAMREFGMGFNLSDLENKLVSVDKSTISRTIHLFLEKQLIHSFDDGSGSVKYSVCKDDCNCGADDLHVHFYCNYCKSAFCLEDIIIPKFELPDNMQIESANFVIKGYCGKCNKIAT
jgi:Fur family ferric uptake transcriptional regulator